MKIALIFTGLAMIAFSLIASVSQAEDATQATKDFVEKASVCSQFEVMSSRLALGKSSNSEIKQFAEDMIEDHSKANEKLAEVVSSSNVSGLTVPSALDEKHQKLYDRLSPLSGDEFDREYMKVQVEAHDNAVSLYQNYAAEGDNGALKAFAADTLPVLKDHQEHAKKLKDSLS